MKKTLSLLLPAVVLCLVALVACNKEKAQGGDALGYRITLSETSITLSEAGECKLTADYSPADKAVVMMGAQATESGTKPVLTGDKHETRYIRPFIAF